MDAAERVGDRVKQLRFRLGLSQTQIAGDGVSASYVSLIESGKREPTPQTLGWLASRLSTSVQYLRDGIHADAAEQEQLTATWAELAIADGDAHNARAHAGDVLRRATTTSDAGWRMRLVLALCEEKEGQLEKAIEDLEGIRDDMRGRAPQGLLPVTVALCRCYREVGDLAHSIAVAEDALRAIESLGLEGTDEEAEVRASLMAAYYQRGDLVKATRLGKDLMQRTRHASNRARGAAYWNASLVANERGDLTQAKYLAERALNHLSEANQARHLVRLQLMYAGLLLRQVPPEAEAADAALADVWDRVVAFGSEIDVAYLETESARAKVALGDYGAAQALASGALTRLGTRPRQETAQALLVLAQALRGLGEPEQAAIKGRQAAQLLDVTAYGRQAALAWNELAGLLVDLGDQEEAMRAYQRALASLGVQQMTSTLTSSGGLAG